MRVIFIFLMLPLSITQAQFNDDFSDGDISNNPEWIGLTEWFRVDPQRESLQLFAPAEAGTAWLFTESQSVEDAVWQFSFRMGFNPSSTNYAQVYLASDAPDINLINNAFYLVLGTTADNISLWHRRGNSNQRLIEGLAKRLDFNTVEGKVRVTRHKGGLFVLESDMGAGWVEEGRSEASVGFSASWFGVSCHYTATRSTLFWFDDIVVSGEQFRDTIPPAISSIEVMNSYRIRLRFTKPVDQLNVEPSFFALENSNLLPGIVTLTEDAFALDLQYSDGIPVGSDKTLTISGLTDHEGNVMPETALAYSYNPAAVTSFRMTSLFTAEFCFSHALLESSLSHNSFQWEEDGSAISTFELTGGNCIKIEFAEAFPNGASFPMFLNSVVAINGDTISRGAYDLFFYQTRRNDLVITEVMHNPTPPVLLPDSECLELYNRGDFPVDVSGFRLSVGTRNATLPSYLLFPGDYLLLVPTTMVNSWEETANKLAVTSWPLLPNAGGDIVLRDGFDRVITSLRYDNRMGEFGFKSEGGWSLEVKDVDNLSGHWDNWAWSNDLRGGTPGAPNSVTAANPDIVQPALEDVFLLNDSCIVLEFSEPMGITGNHTIGNMLIVPDELVIGTLEQEEVFLTTTKVCFSTSIPENRAFIFKFAEAPKDFAGNILLPPGEIRFARPVKADFFDVVINELLFDPPVGGEDFVELYNRSSKMIDLSKLYIARNNSSGIPEKLIPLSSQVRTIFPGDYLAFTANKQWTQDFYGATPATVRSLLELPNYVNSGGTVFLSDVAGTILDRMDYSDKMHFSLLTSTKGVSLERLDVDASSGDVFNWHSASADVGYATPGRANSQAGKKEGQKGDDWIFLEPEIFTPNQDGMDDLLFVRYQFNEPGYSCTVTIFNRGGQPVRHLVNNQLVGNEGFFTWDGTDDTGLRCPTGLYIVFVRSFNLKGDVREVKKVTVLGSGR
jgi:hypothetical protein